VVFQAVAVVVVAVLAYLVVLAHIYHKDLAAVLLVGAEAVVVAVLVQMVLLLAVLVFRHQ
jgi:hypothetical protein